MERQDEKTKKPYNGKLSIYPEHPHYPIKIQFGMLDGCLQTVVLCFKFDQNRLNGYRDVKGQNMAYCITLANGLYSPVLP